MEVLRCDQEAKFGERAYDRVVLLDRDGIVNVDYGYVFEREKFEWIEGAQRLIRELKSRDIGVAIVTNQSGIGRGYYREEQFLNLMAWVGDMVPVDVAIYCPHAPEAGCPGRKPGSRMVSMALEYLGCTADQALLIGDKESDLEAAQRLGVKSAQFSGGDLYQFSAPLL